MIPKQRKVDDTALSGIAYTLSEVNPELCNAILGDEEGNIKSSDSSLKQAATSLGEIGTVQRTPIIELSSEYGLSELRDIWQELNGGTVTSAPTAEYQLQTGTTADGTAILDSSVTGRYIPGYSAEIGIGLRLDTGFTPTGDQDVHWGGVSNDRSNGLFFGYDANGLFVNRFNLGIDEKVQQANWNVDPLDGTGPSGYTLNPEDGNIYRVDFTWYGYGNIKFGVIGTDLNGKQKFIPCHVFSGFNSTSIASPNLKITIEANNNTTTNNNLNVFVGGRQYSIVGKYIPRYRFVDDFRAGVTTSTTRLPMVSFQRKDATVNSSIKFQAVESIIVTEPTLIEVFLDPVLTGAVFGNPDGYTASETTLNSDTSATAVSGGILLFRTLVDANVGNDSTFSISELDFEVPVNKIATVTARTLSGTGSATILFRMKEEW